MPFFTIWFSSLPGSAFSFRPASAGLRSKDALARFNDLFDVGVRLVEVGVGKGMGFDPEIDVAGQFSEQDILFEPTDVVPVPEDSQIDVAVGVIGVLCVGPVQI